MACHEIASTDNVQKKNEILVESLGGLTGGVAFGFATGVTLLIMATPVGWVGALIIGIAGAGFSYGTGLSAKKLYSTYGTSIDFASATKISAICQ